MIRTSRTVAPIVVLLGLGGCADTPTFKTTQFNFGDGKTLATTGGVRIITERERDQSDGTRQKVVCTEPSPDYAIASNRAISGNGNASVPGLIGGIVSSLTFGATASDAITETATPLAGRNAGVLALRDGLYAACQAYANGVIGHDAYSIILSQYGSLLVALAAEPPPAGTAAAKAAADPRASNRTTLATLLVACISEHDRTRGPVNFAAANPSAMLSPQYCRQVMARSLTFAVRN